MIVVFISCEAYDAVVECVSCRIPEIIIAFVGVVAMTAPVAAIKAKPDVMSFVVEQMLVVGAAVEAFETAVRVCQGAVIVMFDAVHTVFVAVIILPAASFAPVRPATHPK